jgi:CheY-like chemotaxis protein
MKPSQPMRREGAAPIVIIDDSADDLFFTRRLIERAGLGSPLVCLQGAAEGMDYLQRVARKRRPPRLILLDIKMYLLNGFEILRWIREQDVLRQTPVVMLSGSDQEEDRRRAGQLGATGFLVKEPTVEQLQAVTPGLGGELPAGASARWAAGREGD